jgi:hypothetical protein
MSKIKRNNNELYRELQLPFDGVDEANKNIKEFCEELYDLRAKHRIQDLFFVIGLTVKFDDGDEGSTMVCNHYGDPLRQESLAGFGYGYSQSLRQENTLKLIERAMKAVEQPKSRK